MARSTEAAKAHSTAPINEILRKDIERRHCGFKWILQWETPTGTGYGGDLGKYSGGFIDAFAMGAWPSDQHVRHAYEMKASRADFLKEIKTPRKRRAALRFSNFFWIIAPPGICKPEEIPVECGLIEVPLGGGEGRVVVNAPFRESIAPTWNFLGAVWRRAEVKGSGGDIA